MQKVGGADGVPCSSSLILGTDFKLHAVDLHGFHFVESGKTIVNGDTPPHLFLVLFLTETHVQHGFNLQSYRYSLQGVKSTCK